MIRPRPQPSMPQWSQKLYEKAIFKSLHWSSPVLSPPWHDVAKKFMKRPISNFYNNSNSTDFFENVSYKTEILQNNSWQISQKCMLQEFKIVIIRETRWLQNLSRSWPFLSLPSFSFYFILSFVGFNFSSRYCVSGAGYSWILQKIPVEFPTEISDHKSTWLWIFETSKPGILCMLNSLKKKRPKQMDCSQTYYWLWDLHVQLYHCACGRGKIYFSFNFIVCFWLHCACSTAKRKSILDSTKTNGSFGASEHVNSQILSSGRCEGEMLCLPI